jgi:hypothetical protein
LPEFVEAGLVNAKIADSGDFAPLFTVAFDLPGASPADGKVTFDPASLSRAEIVPGQQRNRMFRKVSFHVVLRMARSQ